MTIVICISTILSVSILFWGLATLDKTITMVGFVGMIALLLYIINIPDQSQYIQIKRIDSNKYIQCIESQQYIVSSGSKSADAVTTMLDATGKPIKCSNSSIIYTQEQTELPINKDKDFIIKEVQF